MTSQRRLSAVCAEPDAGKTAIKLPNPQIRVLLFIANADTFSTDLRHWAGGFVQASYIFGASIVAAKY
jgi:hypothetical protein